MKKRKFMKKIFSIYGILILFLQAPLNILASDTSLFTDGTEEIYQEVEDESRKFRSGSDDINDILLEENNDNEFESKQNNIIIEPQNIELSMVNELDRGKIHYNSTMDKAEDKSENQIIPVVSNSLYAEYSDDYFLTSAVNGSNDLAQLSIVASDVAYKDTATFLRSCGFLDIVDQKIDRNHQTLMIHPIKVTIGHKTISFNQEDYDLYAILVRGTTDAMEWVSNFDLNSLNNDCANQFVIPKNEIRSLFDSYKKNYFTSGTTAKIWITGHSRGGAVANLLAHELSSKYAASNVYAYTFASAKVVTKKIDDANIFNYLIQEDIVPKVPPGYVRYGKDIVLNTKGHMDKLYQQMTSKKYEGTVLQAHSLEAYMCAFLNTITFPEECIKISMNITCKDLYLGEKVLLEATVSGTSSKVKWTSDNKKIATVSSKGLVTAKKAGTVTITANVNDVTAQCKITVIKKQSPSIKLNKSSLVLNKGKSITLKTTVTGTSSRIVWKSSNISVATVTNKGRVTGKKPGTCTISATVNGRKAICRVTVKNSATASVAYKKLIKQYEEKYGKAKCYYYGSNKIYWTGLCFAKLLDFNNDNTNELILVYQTEVSDIRKVQYQVELWTFDGKRKKKIASQISWTGNNIPFFGEISISKYSGKYLLELTDVNDLSDRYYGTKKDGSIGLVDEFIWKGDLINGSWCHNGKEISQDIFERFSNKYRVNQTKYIFWKTEYEEIIINEIVTAKKLLTM